MCTVLGAMECVSHNECGVVFFLFVFRRVNHLVTSLEEIYSTATVTDVTGREYRLDPELTELFTTSRDYDELQWAWEAWHNVTGPRMKSMYVELVDGMNEGARDNGEYLKALFFNMKHLM